MKESESKLSARVCVFLSTLAKVCVCVSGCVVDSHAGISSLGKEHILF